ncbi:MAG TPA: hypothetical protein VHQ90_18750 [Thermoanaerobaculia bacterium]|nr:hypothetical protein [Thermoanaerobaculia bacterium]
MTARHWRWWWAGCAALVFVLALAARWRWGATQEGPSFQPRPDALEYAASAQALAQSGKFYLQVGPVQARPRYSPGWPALVAAALEVGVDPWQAWRLTGLLGAVLAVLLAGAARRTVLLLRGGAGAGPAVQAAGLAAGLLAGTGWALAPGAVTVGRTLLSDEPTALAALSSLLLLIGALLRSTTSPAGNPLPGAASLLEEPAAAASGAAGGGADRRAGTPERGRRAPRPGPSVWYGAAGVAFGLTLAMRPVEGALLLPPEALLLACAARKLALARPSHTSSTAAAPAGVNRWRRAALPVLAWCAGAALPAALTAGILLHSGLPPLPWSGYAFWSPAQRQDFSWRYALAGYPELTADGRAESYLGLAARALLGLPGVSWDWYLGRFWPMLGWLAAPWLWLSARRAGRRGDGSAAALAWAVAALVSWALCRMALMASYYFPAGRFYLPAHAVPLLCLAAACGLAACGPRRWLRPAGYGTAAALLAVMAFDFRAFRRDIEPGEPPERIYRRFNRWIQLDDKERAAQQVPFDPLYAQALGLLDPEIVADIRQWGELPPTFHVLRLRRKGLLPP